MKSKANEAKFNNVPVTEDNIKIWVKKDIESVYSLAYEILSTPEVLDAITKKLYAKHLLEVQREEAKLKSAEAVQK